VNEYQGIKITDPYQWLEDADNPDVKKWTDGQAAYARDYLDHLPSRAEMVAKLKSWNEFETSKYSDLKYRRGTYFAQKLAPPKNQAILVSLSSLTAVNSEHVVLDPNLLNSAGTTAIDFYVPSLDGKYVAVSLSNGGSEVGELHVYETATGKELADVIPRVNNPTAGGSVAWDRQGSGFYYTRYPLPGERPAEDMDFYQKIYFHKLGSSYKDDEYALGNSFPRIAEVHLSSAEDGSAVLATVANGDGGEFAHYVLGAGGKWTQVTRFKDKATAGALGLHGDLYLTSLAGSPRGKVLRLSLSDLSLSHAETVVKQGRGVIEDVIPAENRVFVVYLVGGPSEIESFDLQGKSLGKLEAAPLSDVGGVIHTKGDSVAFKSQSYVQPAAWYLYQGGDAEKTALVTRTPIDFSDIEVKREYASSKDGTRVPLTILFRKSARLDGMNPTLLYGYGGYGISLTPRFSPDIHLWLEHGGVYAVANLRGGGEFGESWHKQGNLTHKQHVFDDFIGCAEYLIREHYTNPEKLAIEGGSNGGLLMGAALTQRPDLFHVVVSHVGIYDMLRVEKDPNGAFNVTEFGSVKDPAQFKALYAYSPVHHVKDGAKYPAILLLTGANDGRVNPYHSKKMAARLQAATRSGKPVLLRVTFDGGHGIGRSVKQKVEEEGDVFAFLFNQLGMKY
jgi:prolyl oligopeptidase